VLMANPLPLFPGLPFFSVLCECDLPLLIFLMISWVSPWGPTDDVSLQRLLTRPPTVARGASEEFGASRGATFLLQLISEGGLGMLRDRDQIPQRLFLAVLLFFFCLSFLFLILSLFRCSLHRPPHPSSRKDAAVGNTAGRLPRHFF